MLVGVAGVIATVASQMPPRFSRAAGTPPASTPVERGRYLVQIAGCNDCHTAGYVQAGGTIPEPHWLTGDTLGFRGPWGTTYASNLRLYMQQVSEEQWVQLAQTIQTRPPMPWFVLHHMTDADLRALYAFVRALGPAGVPAPAYLPPGQEPPPPYVQFPGPP
jgi:mono/diheme cytochrome c family protein